MGKRRKHSKEYIEYLKSPEWEAMRTKVLNRDDHKCTSCESTACLQVHHKTYRRLRHELLDDLITLCKKCHKAIHRKPKRKVPSIREIIKYLPGKQGRNQKGQKTAGYNCSKPVLIKIPIDEWRERYGK